MNAIPTSPEEHNPAEPTGRQALLQEIGNKLNQSRSASGESIEEAVRKLKIRKNHLLALESGHWDNMPDDIYGMGFLRQYCQYLHVDLSDEIHRLKNDQYALTKPLTFPDPPVAPSRRWAWVAGVAFVLLFILFNITTKNINMGNSDVAEAPDVAATETPTADASSSSSTTDSNNPSQATMPNPAAEIQAIGPLPATVPAENIIMHTTPTLNTAITKTPAAKKSTQAVPVIAKTITATKRKMAAPQVNLSTTAAQNKAANSAIHHVRFDAVGSPVWLQISRPDPTGNGKGKLLKEVLLQPGLHTTIRIQTESLWITCGNAPALRISVDGRVFATPGSLGTGKKVLRDYRFSIGNN